MMRTMLVSFALVVVAAVAVLGWRGQLSSRPPIRIFPDMVDQPRYHPQGASRFFADGRSMRPPPAGTVAFGGVDYFSGAGSPRQNPDLLQADDAFYRGKQGNEWVKHAPVTIDAPLLRRGQRSYNIHCAPCHGATGAGNGITTQYGMAGVATYHDDRLRATADGEIFNTITNGKGVMMGYGCQVAPADRWAIVAYVRALQLSQRATLDDVPEPFRTELQR